MELTHSKSQDSSPISILVLKKLIIKENGNIENVLRRNSAVLIPEETLLMKELQNYLQINKMCGDTKSHPQ